MKVQYVLLAVVAVLGVHCGGAEPPPAQDPSAVPATSGADAGAGAPQTPPAGDQPNK